MEISSRLSFHYTFYYPPISQIVDIHKIAKSASIAKTNTPPRTSTRDLNSAFAIFEIDRSTRARLPLCHLFIVRLPTRTFPWRIAIKKANFENSSNLPRKIARGSGIRRPSPVVADPVSFSSGHTRESHHYVHTAGRRDLRNPRWETISVRLRNRGRENAPRESDR